MATYEECSVSGALTPFPRKAVPAMSEIGAPMKKAAKYEAQMPAKAIIVDSRNCS
jgi:hypothetical protein